MFFVILILGGYKRPFSVCVLVGKWPFAFSFLFKIFTIRLMLTAIIAVAH